MVRFIFCLAVYGAAFAYEAYVANGIDGSVTVLNTDTNSIITTISVGSGPIGVAATPDGKWVYVSNQSSNTVSVINTATHAVVATLPVGGFPWGVTVSPDGSTVYVANLYDSNLSVIDVVTNTVTGTLCAGEQPVTPAVTPDGDFIYVTNAESPYVTVIDLSDDSTSTISAFEFPFGIAITPDGVSAYVTNYVSNSVSIIDLSDNSVGDPIPLPGPSPIAVAITPDGKTAYICNGTVVSVLDVESSVVVADPSVTSPSGLAVTPDGAFVYCSNYLANTVTVIATRTNEVIELISVGGGPQGIAILPQFGPLPPKSLQGVRRINWLPFQKQFVDALTWQASPSKDVVAYAIYQDGKKIGSTSSLSFASFKIDRREGYTYKVRAVDSKGQESAPVAVTIS